MIVVGLKVFEADRISRATCAAASGGTRPAAMTVRALPAAVHTLLPGVAGGGHVLHVGA